MARGSSNPSVALAGQLREDIEKLLDTARASSLSAHARRKIHEHIKTIQQSLDTLTREIDPIHQPDAVFDPSEPKVIGRFVALALVAQPKRPLISLERFYGSGVYAIYYRGDLPSYRPISGTETPIYVGKADPAVSTAKTPAEQGDKLSGRLREHTRNIRKVENLNIQDFDYRALVVQSGWQAAAENYLIRLFSPIWNKETRLIFGVGKHGDAALTRSNKRSPWDILHPGRTWASSELLENSKTDLEISTSLATHFSTIPIYMSIELVLLDFVSELRQL